MDLQQIKYFLAVVDSGTFLAASKQVFVSQPTLSAGIKKLEESLDCELFYRGSRAATLTPEGEKFLATARTAYNQLLKVKADLSEHSEYVNVGVLPNIHMDHVAQILYRFRKAHPHILIKLSVGNAAFLEKQLKSRQLDVTIVNSHQEKSDSFVPLIKEALCVVVSSKHHLSSSKQLSLASLQGLEFIERVNCSFWQKVFDEFVRQSIEPETIMQVESDEFVLPLVSANVGCSIMTNRTTPYDIVFIPIEGFDIDRSIGVCLRDHHQVPLSSAVEAFIDSIEQEFGARVL